MDQLGTQPEAADIVLPADVLDEIVPPGTNLSQADRGYETPARPATPAPPLTQLPAADRRSRSPQAGCHHLPHRLHVSHARPAGCAGRLRRQAQGCTGRRWARWPAGNDMNVQLLSPEQQRPYVHVVPTRLAPADAARLAAPEWTRRSQWRM
jgi:hypothetical protein